MAVIGFLDGAAAGYAHLWLSRVDRRNASSNYIECSVDPPDSIVYLPRTIDGDDHVIEQGGDIMSTLEEEQACG
jgi:hypothetical protein